MSRWVTKDKIEFVITGLRWCYEAGSAFSYSLVEKPDVFGTLEMRYGECTPRSPFAREEDGVWEEAGYLSVRVHESQIFCPFIKN